MTKSLLYIGKIEDDTKCTTHQKYKSTQPQYLMIGIHKKNISKRISPNNFNYIIYHIYNFEMIQKRRPSYEDRTGLPEIHMYIEYTVTRLESSVASHFVINFLTYEFWP